MDANIVVTQFTAGAIAVWGIQQLKNSPKFPWLKDEGQKVIKRLSSIVAAIGIHTGISHVWQPGTIAGSHVLIINIPPLAVIAVTVWHWLGQYVIQEGWYQVAYNKPAPPKP